MENATDKSFLINVTTNDTLTTVLWFDTICRCIALENY